MASDMDIIDAMRTRKMNPKLYSLEQIMCDVPMLSYENPLLYSLYLHHNKDALSDEDRAKVSETIETLKYNRDLINKINMDYMTRDC